MRNDGQEDELTRDDGSIVRMVPFLCDPGPMDKVIVFCYNLLIHNAHTRVATCSKVERVGNGWESPPEGDIVY